MRTGVIIVSSWIFVMACMLIIPHLLPSDKKAAAADPVVPAVTDTHEGPVVGHSGPREKIQDVVQMFLKSVHEGNLEEAATFIDDNHMLDLMAKDKPADKTAYMKNHVRLFEPGQMEKATIIAPKMVSRNMKCTAEIKLKDGRQLTLVFGLTEMVNDEGPLVEKQWFFTNIERTVKAN